METANQNPCGCGPKSEAPAGQSLLAAQAPDQTEKVGERVQAVGSQTSPAALPAARKFRPSRPKRNSIKEKLASRSQRAAELAQRQSASLSRFRAAEVQPAIPATESKRKPKKGCGCGEEVSELVVPEGAEVFLSKSIRVEKLTNKGTLKLASGVTLDAREFTNDGEIVCDGDLTVLVRLFLYSKGKIAAPEGSVQFESEAEKTGIFTLEHGSVTAKNGVTWKSSSDTLWVRGGTIKAEKIGFDCMGSLNLKADKLDGALSLQAKEVYLSADDDSVDLNQVRLLTGNTIIYKFGSISCGSISVSGDLIMLANGNISISGDVNTGSGFFRALAGTGFSPSGTPISDPDCSGSQRITNGSYSVSPGSGGTFTIAGNITAGNCQIGASTATMTDGTFNLSGYLDIQNGSLHVTADDSVSIGGALTVADGRILIDATDSSSHGISIGGTVLTNGQTIILAAGGSIRVDGNVTNSLGTNQTDIRIFANYGGSSSSEFVIGGSGQSNGVNGSIANTTNSGGGSGDTTRGVYVSNGAGGIRIVNGSAINVAGSASRAASIILDAHDGDVTLEGGTLSADGSSTYPAGLILILADELITENGATITASDSGSAVDHYVAISTSRISYSGGLTISANGDGRSDISTVIALCAKGSNTWVSGHAPGLDPDTTIAVGELNFQRTALTIEGDGDLTMDAYGDYMAIYANAYPVTFDGDDVLIRAIGSNTLIAFTYPGSPAGNVSLDFAGGTVTCYADNPDGDAGQVVIGADLIAVPNSTVSLNANATGTGDGGEIQIVFDDGDVALGKISCSAAGGGDGGNGKTITVNGVQATSSITLDSTFNGTQLNASALGSNGDGGTIHLQSGSLDATAADTPTFYSTGSGTGKGGTIHIEVAGDITVDAEPGLTFVAIAYGTGDGGKVELIGDNVSINAGYIYISAGTASGSDGNGGTLTVEAAGDLTVGGTVQANGVGEGTGGNISLTADGNIEIDTAEFVANGGDDGGDGGTHTFTASQNLELLECNIYANGGQNGGEGGTLTLEAAAEFIFGGTMYANGGEDSNGGTVEVTADQIDIGGSSMLRAIGRTSFDPPATAIFAEGAGTGDGGEITLTTESADLTIGNGSDEIVIAANSAGSGNGGNINGNCGNNLIIDGAAITATAGPDGDGNGGAITKQAAGTMTLAGTINSNGAGTGKGGTVTLTAGGAFSVGAGGLINANGGANGAGGSITILPDGGINLTGITTLKFSAHGNGTGGGGKVFLNNTNTGGDWRFDILTVINVDAGASAPWNLATSPGLGSIRLNNYTCRQWRLDSDNSRVWPKRIWVAQGDTAPSSTDRVPWDLAISSVFSNSTRTLFANHHVELFVFASNADFGGFCNQVNDVAASGGLTWRIHGTGIYIYCCPWESGSKGDPASSNPYTDTEYVEVAAHELGHAYSLSQSALVSTNASWISARSADITAVNNGTPCDASTGPFRDVTDIAHKDSNNNPAPQTVCDATTHTLRSDYTPPNFAICQQLDPVFASGYEEELHAQMFAYAATAGGSGARPVVDKIVANNYFQNLLTWAQGEL